MVYRQQLGISGVSSVGELILKLYILVSSLNSSLDSYILGWTFNTCVGVEGSKQGTDNQARIAV